MEEKKLQFTADAFGVFMKYGIKSVTMDDLARHLGISKKTVYTFVSDKNELVRNTLQFQCDLERETIESIHKKGYNAIDEMFEIGKFVSSILRDVHPSIHYDLEKYHGEVFAEVMREHELHIYACMVRNLKQGINEKLYRKDLNAEVISKIYIKKIEVVFDAEMFPPSDISFQEVYAVLFRYHILGVASAKGVEYLTKKLKKLKSKTL
jgi:AcrR family transcriptional regulator